MLMREEKRCQYSWHCRNHRCLKCALCHCLARAIRSCVPEKDSLFPNMSTVTSSVRRQLQNFMVVNSSSPQVSLSVTRSWKMRACLCPNAMGSVERHTAYHSQGSLGTSGRARQASNHGWSHRIIASCFCLCQVSIASSNEVENNSLFRPHIYEDTLTENVLWTLVKCG